MAALATGCATEPPIAEVKRVVADPAAHLQSAEFSPASLPPPVREILRQTAVPAQPSRPLRLKVERQTDRHNDSLTSPGVISYTPQGEGLFHVHAEYTANDIPFLSNFMLCYLGINCLRSQTVRHDRMLGDGIISVVSIDRLDAGRHAPKPGAEYRMELTIAVMGAGPGRPEAHSCRAGERYPAMTIHPKLTGEAIDLECEIKVRDVLQARSRHSVLYDYGLALEREFKSIRWTTEFFYIDVIEPAPAKVKTP